MTARVDLARNINKFTASVCSHKRMITENNFLGL